MILEKRPLGMGENSSSSSPLTPLVPRCCLLIDVCDKEGGGFFLIGGENDFLD